MTASVTNYLADILHGGAHSLVIANGTIRTFDGKGVSDLFILLQNEPEFLKGATIADKVVGKAAAALMVLGYAKEIYADVISRYAIELLESNGIATTYGKAVAHITNRTGTDLCPLEKRCIPCVTANECLVQIRAFAEELKAKKCAGLK